MCAKPYDNFHNNLLGIAETIRDKWPDEFSGISKGYLEIGSNTLEEWPDAKKKDALIQFTDKTHQYWSKEIKNHDEEFFINNVGIIMPKAKKYSKIIADFLRENYLDDDDRDDLWQYIEGMVMCCIKYIHHKRKPDYVLKDDHKYKPGYKKSFFDQIDLNDLTQNHYTKVNLDS